MSGLPSITEEKLEWGKRKKEWFDKLFQLQQCKIQTFWGTIKTVKDFEGRIDLNPLDPSVREKMPTEPFGRHFPSCFFFFLGLIYCDVLLSFLIPYRCYSLKEVMAFKKCHPAWKGISYPVGNTLISPQHWQCIFTDSHGVLSTSCNP